MAYMLMNIINVSLVVTIIAVRTIPRTAVIPIVAFIAIIPASIRMAIRVVVSLLFEIMVQE